jgi:hypothetical protein
MYAISKIKQLTASAFLDVCPAFRNIMKSAHPSALRKLDKNKNATTFNILRFQAPNLKVLMVIKKESWKTNNRNFSGSERKPMLLLMRREYPVCSK